MRAYGAIQDTSEGISDNERCLARQDGEDARRSIASSQA